MYTYRSNNHSCPIFCRCWHPVCTATAAIQAARGSSYSQSVTSQRSCTKRLLVRTDAVVEARLTSHSQPVNSHRSCTRPLRIKRLMYTYRNNRHSCRTVNADFQFALLGKPPMLQYCCRTCQRLEYC
jgi:hypothetical protein